MLQEWRGSWGVIALSVWGFLIIRKMELATLIDYICDVIKKISDLLKEKEDELDQLEGDPARFTLLQLLSFVNDDEKTVPIPALTVNGAIRETPAQTDFDKQHQR